MRLKFLMLLTCIFYMNADAQESTSSKNVTIFTLHAPELDAVKKIWVYLPPNYNDSRKKFPVIYMPDGQNLFDKSTSYAGEWRIDETLDSLKAQVIVIGIEHGGNERINELTPYKNEKYGGGRADVYLDFIMHTLKPEIDRRYRTKSDRENTIMFGSSLGGLLSYYALLNYPDIFGKAGIFSPSFWFTKDIYDLTEYDDSIDAKIYFMAGDSEDTETVPDLDRMEALVQKKIKKKENLHKKIVPDGKHNEALWAKEFADAYLWLMDKS
jgi:predicted alpha/beta superfamily hydrolase